MRPISFCRCFQPPGRAVKTNSGFLRRDFLVASAISAVKNSGLVGDDTICLVRQIGKSGNPCKRELLRLESRSGLRSLRGEAVRSGVVLLRLCWTAHQFPARSRRMLRTSTRGASSGSAPVYVVFWLLSRGGITPYSLMNFHIS